VAITGATGSSYTPTTADFGKALDVVVGYTDGATEHITALAGTVAAAPEVSFNAGDSTTDENAPLTLNTLNVAFTDAGSDTVTVSLDASHGTLSLGSAAGVTATDNGSAAVSLSGTLSAIDAALADGVTYTPNSGFVGADTVSFAASDGAFNSNTATLNVNVLGPVATSFTIANAAGPASGGWSYDPENGHYYKYVAATSDDWTTAMAAAAADNGAYLANITSGAESVFVSQAIASGSTAWTGGQSTQDPASGRPQSGSVPFYWFDGPEAGALFTYTSWNNDNLPPGGGEPTGGFNTSVEALQVGSNGEWNDVPTTWANGQGGYIEEYGGLAGQVAFTENTSTDLATSVLLAEDTDTYGTLTVKTVVAAHGTVTLNGDVISYDPSLDYSGADSFTYTISDGTFTSTGTVSFNVAAVPTLLWNTSSGDWVTSAATWSTSAVPTNADDVTINAASDTPYTVTIASGEAASAQTLTLDSAAATLLDAGSLTLTGGLVVEAGAFELHGGSLHALSISVASTANFSGYGTIASPIAVTGTVEASGGNLDFASYVTGHGTFSIDAGATLEFDGLVTTGSVVSFAASTGTLIIEQSTSFQGEVSGALASGDVIDLGGLLSNGNIVATQTGDTFQTAVSYDSVHGTTLLTVIDETHGQSTFLALAGDYTTSIWTVTSDGHGGVDIADPPAAASLTVASGASLEIPNAVVTAETVTFHGSTGSLTLDAPSSFHGTIAGFTGDGTLAGSDQIDLKGIDYHSSSFAESFNARTDTLSVSDGTDDASLHFTGSYVAANFSFTTDGNGGTIVYDPPVSPNPALAPAKTAVADVASETSHGFVFNFANAGHDTAPDFHPTAGEQHPMPANAQTALGIIHDDGRGNTAMVPDGHDALTMAGILKAQLHADFHFV
jgi:Cadherin-like domain